MEQDVATYTGASAGPLDAAAASALDAASADGAADLEDDDDDAEGEGEDGSEDFGGDKPANSPIVNAGVPVATAEPCTAAGEANTTVAASTMHHSSGGTPALSGIADQALAVSRSDAPSNFVTPQ